MPVEVRAAERIYAVVLRAFPASFRRRLGRDMTEAFRDGCYAARERSGVRGVAAHTLRASAEAASQGVRERTSGYPLSDPRSPRRNSMIERTLTNFRYALRTLRRAPVFTLVAAATLAVGIGANAAIFSVVSGVLLQPLPFTDPDELVVFQTRFKDRGGIQLSEPEFVDLEGLTTFRIAAIDYQTLTLGGAETPERLRVSQFSDAVLGVLDVEPAMGRAFTTEDDHPDSDRVVLLSHGLWQQGFAGTPEVLGRTIELEGIEHTVIGVMGEGFAYPDPGVRAWIPLRLDRDDLWERNNHYLYAVGRLGDGVSMEAANAELEVLAARLNEQYPEFYADGGFAFELSGMLDDAVGDSRTPLLTLFAAVAFVLLVACANVANLLLARADARRHEIAVRCALGSGRGAIVAQLLCESLLLGLLGGAMGLALAAWGTRMLLGLSPDALPRAENISVDGGVLLFAVAVSVATSVLFGLLPATHAASGNVQGALKEIGRSQAGSLRGRRSRAGLVVAEVALASVLLIGGGMMLRSFVNLRNVDPGFEHDGVLTMQLALPGSDYEEPIEVVRYFENVLDEVRTVAAVETVGAVARLPLARGANRWSLQIEGAVVEEVADAPVGQIQQATPGYFDAMGLTLIRGRFFDANDIADAPGVAVVSESFAAQHWPDEDPVGKRVKVFLEDWPWLEVVGVVADVRQIGLKGEVFPKIYFAHAQSFQTAYVSPANMHLVIRTSADPASLIAPVRDRVWSVNDAVPLGLVAPMNDVIAGSLAAERFTVVLLTLFGAVALFLAAVGIAGVIGYSVSERTRELGIRVALGADRARVTRLVVVPTLMLTLVGVLLGIVGSTALTGMLGDMLFGVAPIDPVTYAGVVVVFVIFALGACYIPARRAARVDPVISLRAD